MTANTPMPEHTAIASTLQKIRQRNSSRWSSKGISPLTFSTLSPPRSDA
jgi:hypothetical protein